MNQNYNQEQNNLVPNEPRQPEVSLGESLFSWVMTLFRAAVVATPLDTRLSADSFPFGVFGVAFVLYVIIERLVYERCMANRHKKSIYSADNITGALYLLVIAAVYCFALGYDLAGTAWQRANYLNVDIIILVLVAVFIIVDAVILRRKYTKFLEALESQR